MECPTIRYGIRVCRIIEATEKEEKGKKKKKNHQIKKEIIKEEKKKEGNLRNNQI